MTLLDQAIAHGAGSVLTDNVVEMLGAQGVSEIPMLLAEIAEVKLQKRLRVLISYRMDRQIGWCWLVGCRRCFIRLQLRKWLIRELHLPLMKEKAVRDLANLMSPEFIQLAYQFSLTGYRDLPLAVDGRSAFEMLCCE